VNPGNGFVSVAYGSGRDSSIVNTGLPLPRSGQREKGGICEAQAGRRALKLPRNLTQAHIISRTVELSLDAKVTFQYLLNYEKA
jgi:hypothetical protein